MAYYVDTGSDLFIECDTLIEAREVAQTALDAAADFRARMGWTPYWGRALEIRRGKSGLLINTCFSGEERNRYIESKTKTHDVLYLKE